jgi:hypothetical protein
LLLVVLMKFRSRLARAFYEGLLERNAAEEKFKANAAKIPNICRHFGIRCLTLEEFMEAENWRF